RGGIEGRGEGCVWLRSGERTRRVRHTPQEAGGVKRLDPTLEGARLTEEVAFACRGRQMIRKVRVKNFKSIADLTLDLGRITVLIGANGSGKSNILEAFALASAAAQNKLDNEFLSSRGIRVTEAQFMRSAFDKVTPSADSIQRSIQKDKNLAMKQ